MFNFAWNFHIRDISADEVGWVTEVPWTVCFTVRSFSLNQIYHSNRLGELYNFLLGHKVWKGMEESQRNKTRIRPKLGKWKEIFLGAEKPNFDGIFFAFREAVHACLIMETRQWSQTPTQKGESGIQAEERPLSAQFHSAFLRGSSKNGVQASRGAMELRRKQPFFSLNSAFTLLGRGLNSMSAEMSRIWKLHAKLNTDS